MTMRSQNQLQKASKPHPAFSSFHAESLPNVSAIFSVSTIADREEILAAVRTAALLAKGSGASLSVTVLNESMLYLEAKGLAPLGSFEGSLSSIKAKLLVPRSTRRFPCFALEASITSASFLTAGSISLQVRSVESLPQKLSVKR